MCLDTLCYNLFFLDKWKIQILQNVALHYLTF